MTPRAAQALAALRTALRAAASWRRGDTVILMYHAFGTAPEEATRFVQPVARLEQQLRLLRVLRYRPLRLADYVALRQAARPVPRRAVVLTIDDGYRDTATLAAPVLARHGFPATLFVVTARTGAANDWDAAAGELRGRSLLSWEELRALPPQLELGSHTRTHVELPGVDAATARTELAESLTELLAGAERTVAAVAYPHGATDASVEALAAETGYLCACTAHDGLNTAATPLHALRRIEIEGTDSLPVFALKLLLGRRRLRPRRASS